MVSIYTNNAHLSYDLDFVVRGADAGIVKAMQQIGFKKGKGRHFERARTKYIVEFLPPPAGIGRVIMQKFAHLRTPHGVIILYDPTQCVMDRLAAYYHWNDPAGLKQALLVAKRHRIKMAEVQSWSRGEGMEAKFELFRKALTPHAR